METVTKDLSRLDIRPVGKGRDGHTTDIRPREDRPYVLVLLSLFRRTHGPKESQ